MLFKPAHVNVVPRTPGIPAREERRVCPYTPPAPYSSGTVTPPPPTQGATCYVVPVVTGNCVTVCPNGSIQVHRC